MNHRVRCQHFFRTRKRQLKLKFTLNAEARRELNQLVRELNFRQFIHFTETFLAVVTLHDLNEIDRFWIRCSAMQRELDELVVSLICFKLNNLDMVRFSGTDKRRVWRM